MSGQTISLSPKLGLADYCAQTFPGQWLHAPHYELLMPKLEALARRDIRRLAVFLPPRHSKSEVCSVRFPAWLLGQMPNDRMIVATHTSGLAYRVSRQIRSQITGPSYPFPMVRLSQTEAAVGSWGIQKYRGGLIAAGVGGAIAGHGANALIIDDPHRNRESADSPHQQDRIFQWWQDDALTRLEPDGIVLLMLTRWNTGDLAGRILEHESDPPWEVIRLPALAEEHDPLGRVVGEPLWPERFSLRMLEEIRATTSVRAWTSEYQQRPESVEGNMFKREWFREHYENKAGLAVRAGGIFVDSAFKTSVGADYSCAAVWADTGLEYALLDVWREKVEYPELLDALIALWFKWASWFRERGARFSMHVEDKASGQSAIQTLRRESKVNVEPWKATTGSTKESRADSVTPFFSSKRVLLPHHATWLADWETEHATFPAGQYDDQVDTTSMALTVLPRDLAPAVHMPEVLPSGQRMAMQGRAVGVHAERRGRMRG